MGFLSSAVGALAIFFCMFLLKKCIFPKWQSPSIPSFLLRIFSFFLCLVWTLCFAAVIIGTPKAQLDWPGSCKVILGAMLMACGAGFVALLFSPVLNNIFPPKRAWPSAAALCGRNFCSGAALGLNIVALMWLFGFDFSKLSWPAVFPNLLIVFPVIVFLSWACCTIATDLASKPADDSSRWLTDPPAPSTPMPQANKPNLVPITEISLEPAFLDTLSNTPLRYRYDDVPIDVPSSFFAAPWFSPRVSSPWLSLRHDVSDALFFYAEGHPLAPVPDSKLGRMASDWQRREEPFYFPITGIDQEKSQVMISMLFYREDPHRIPVDEPGAESYRLIGNARNEAMQEQITLCEEGDACALEYDADKDKYLVTCGQPIGYLPKAARRLVDEYGADALAVTIDSTGTDADGREYVFVSVDEA